MDHTEGRNAKGSNHEVIEWQFSVQTQEKPDHVQVLGWNLAAMSKEDEEAAEEVLKELQGGRTHLDEKCTGDEVE